MLVIYRMSRNSSQRVLILSALAVGFFLILKWKRHVTIMNRLKKMICTTSPAIIMSSPVDRSFSVSAFTTFPPPTKGQQASLWQHSEGIQTDALQCDGKQVSNQEELGQPTRPDQRVSLGVQQTNESPQDHVDRSGVASWSEEKQQILHHVWGESIFR